MWQLFTACNKSCVTPRFPRWRLYVVILSTLQSGLCLSTWRTQSWISYRSSVVYITGDADIASLQIRHDLFGTAMHGVQDCIRDRQLTVTTAWTLSVEVRQYIGWTADTAVIFAHTSAKPHATVATSQHQNDVVRTRTRRVEFLPLTVLAQRSLWNIPRTHTLTHSLSLSARLLGNNVSSFHCHRNNTDRNASVEIPTCVLLIVACCDKHN